MAWTNTTKPTTSFTDDTKPSMNTEFIMTEALDFLMTESLDYLITNQSTEYSNDNKNASSWSNDAK